MQKLTKKELKEINGGKVVCRIVISCIDRRTGQERGGVPGVQDDYCC
ncbi:bacteriocin [Chryseobacterium sp. T16E-39]|nr:bacteriocin [Chryseobacterium sp. T16E-39]